MRKKLLRNEDVARVIIGIPKKHRHIRTIIETENESYIFQEATIAGIVRAYITLKTDPTIFGVELVGKRCEERKEGYAKYQLLESGKPTEKVISELSQILR